MSSPLRRPRPEPARRRRPNEHQLEASHLIRGRRQSNQAQVLFLLQNAARFRLKIRRNNYLAENLADHFRQRFGQSGGCI